MDKTNELGDMLDNRAWFGQKWSVIGKVQVLTFLYVHTLLRQVLHRGRLRSGTLEKIVFFEIRIDYDDTA